MDAKFIHTPSSANALPPLTSDFFAFFLQLATYLPLTLRIYFFHCKASVKLFQSSITFLPLIRQASLPLSPFALSPALGCAAATLRPECSMKDCWDKPFLKSSALFLSTTRYHQVKMTLLQNISSLDGIKDTWETCITQVIKDPAMSLAWSEVLESQTDLKKIFLSLIAAYKLFFYQLFMCLPATPSQNNHS